MKRKLAVLLFIIVLMNPFTIVNAITSQNEEVVNNTNSTRQEEIVTPNESDYTFTGTVLTGLSSTFINGLNDTQKQNICLVIPAKTTIIKAWAFYKFSDINKQCNFISLDLSQATQLIEIQDSAFSGCSGIRGSLYLPDTLERLGTHVFDGCSGLDGALRLSNRLTKISDYAFYNCGFQGTLTIPTSVTMIGASAFRQGSSYRGFSGELNIPNSVLSIGTVAFSNQAAITSVVLSNQMTTIPQSAFRYTGLQGVLVLPNTIQKIEATAFAGTQLETVYLSKRVDSSNTNFIQSTSFNECSKLTSIICDKLDYSYVYGALNTATKSKVGYPITVQFNDGQNHQYPTIERLYNQSYQLQKDNNGKWFINSAYTFPKVSGDSNKKWGLTTTARKAVLETDLISQDTLYAITPFSNPTITYGDNIDKVYDGKDAILKVSASHPLAKKIEDAGIGDVVFYYTWSWATIGSSPVVLQGFDEDEYAFKDVRDSQHTIGCDVQIMACVVNEQYKAIPFYTVSHTFSVALKQQESIVHPVYPTQQILVKDGLPTLSLSSGDTEGTISFDQGQVLTVGKHSYAWTFIPTQNTVGNSNYTVVKGMVELDAVDKFTHTLTLDKSSHGSILVNNTSIDRGEDAIIKIVADPGYVLESLYVDDLEVTKNVKNNEYILKNIQNNHILYATFKALPIDDIEDQITNIPEITQGAVTEEQRVEVLETVEYFLQLDKDVQDKVDSNTKLVLYQTMAKLPQIKIESDKPNMTVADNEMLLEALTNQEIEILLNDKDALLAIAVNATEIVPTLIEQEQIDTTLQGAKVCQTLDIKIEKQITSKGHTQTTEITNLTTPTTLSFPVPTTIEPLKLGYVRSLFVIRIHEEDGIIETTVLKNLADNNDKVTISTDKFSCYVLAYDDTLVENPILPPTEIIIPEDPIFSGNQGNPLLNKEDNITLISTSDITNFEGSGIVMLVSIIGIVLSISKKRKI